MLYRVTPFILSYRVVGVRLGLICFGFRPGSFFTYVIILSPYSVQFSYGKKVVYLR